MPSNTVDDMGWSLAGPTFEEAHLPPIRLVCTAKYLGNQASASLPPANAPPLDGHCALSCLSGQLAQDAPNCTPYRDLNLGCGRASCPQAAKM
eukprot:53264-Amphidinium_carterae.1